MTENSNLNAEVAEDIGSASIDVGNPEIHTVVAELENLLREKSRRVFRSYDKLIRVSEIEKGEQSDDGVTRHAGLSVLRDASAAWLAVEASQVGGIFTQKRRAGKEWKPARVAPPVSLFTLLHTVADESRFPVLRGISMTPTLNCDTPGYDPASQLFLAFPVGMFPEGPKNPTKKHAEEALRRLENPLRGFPFETDADKGVALSGMISAVLRGELPAIPIHGLDAPAAGTGKTKLADIIGIMATGVPPSGITHTTDGDENEKRLVSVLRTGDPVVNIDNISSDLEGDFLCQVITQSSVQGRILGSSEMVRLSCYVLVLATGNNLTFRGDLCRRSVKCRLDAKMADPEEREFDFDAAEEARARRPQLVTDALTIVRAYMHARPKVKLTPFGSFEDWALVRGALVWLRGASFDPAATREQVKSGNPVAEQRAQLLGALARHPNLRHMGTPIHFTIGDLDHVDFAQGQRIDPFAPLRLELGALTKGGAWDKQKVGLLLRTHKDVPFMGVTLRSKTNRQKVNEWWLEGAAEPDLLARSGGATASPTTDPNEDPM